MKPRVLLLVLSVLFMCRCLVSADDADYVGTWSPKAINVLPMDPRGRRQDIASPDKQKMVHVEEGIMSVLVKGKRLPSDPPDLYVGEVAEVLWAPDSKAFALTGNALGTASGPITVEVYVIKGNIVRMYIIPAKDVIDRFIKTYYDCNDTFSDPSAGAAIWIDGSKRLLVVLQVDAHGACGYSAAYIGGYVLEIPSGKIVKEFNERQLLAKYGRHLPGWMMDIHRANVKLWRKDGYKPGPWMEP